MRNGRLYPPLKSAHRTAANASSSSLGLLPTPQAHDTAGSKTPEQVAAMRARGYGVRNLNEVTTNELLLRTPTAQLAENGGSQHPEKRKAGGHGPTLADEIEHLLPTPSVALATGGQASRSGERIDELLLTGIARAAAGGALLPTPAAHDSFNTPENHLRKKPGRQQVTSLQVIVDYDLLSSGGRMPSPSADGSTPPAARHPVQLSLDGLESA